MTRLHDENGYSEEELRAMWGAGVGEGASLEMTVKASSAPAPEEAERMTISAAGDGATLCATVAIRSPGDDKPSDSVNLALRKSDISGLDGIDLPPPGFDYKIERVLGKGGMGVIYTAKQMSLNRDVALKMALPAADSGARSGKLVSEALVTGELEHPGIVPIYDMGHSDDRIYYAMRVVHGAPWSERIGGLNERENVDILLRVADAVAFAHDKGVVHRDIKPENVMLGNYGEVILMDWGLAAGTASGGQAEPISPANAKAGTPAYMAPEMAKGQAGKIGPASDVYLLGAVLFEILTGKRPHTGGNVYACIYAASKNVIQDAGDRDSPLMKAALRAMASDPADRFASVKDFQTRLREVINHLDSLGLAKKAQGYLNDAERTGDYELYSQAIFAFREASAMWEDNHAAEEGEAESRRRFAARAFSKGDFDLALSTARELDDPRALELIGRAEKGRREALSRKRWFKRLFIAAAALGLVVIIVSVAASIIISGQVERERAARELATRQEQIAQQALAETRAAREKEREAAAEREKAQSEALAALERERSAQEEREKAQSETLTAMERARSALEEREKAQSEALAALERERSAQEERLAALSREAEERRQREEAEAERRTMAAELSRKGHLEDASWWVFDADEAARRQSAAATGRQPAEMTLSVGGEAIRFKLVPPGAFAMGSSPLDSQHEADEYLHLVEITAPFYMADTELTRAQWRAVAGVEREEDLMREFVPETAGGTESPEDFAAAQREIWGWRTRPIEPGEESLPATGISFADIERLLLPALTAPAPAGWRVALPTEAQWEYACRAGTGTRFFSGDTEEDAHKVAWTLGNGPADLQRAGLLDANPWGLFDTHGNAGELVRDAYSPDFYLSSGERDPYNGAASPYRTFRGGTCIFEPSGCRSASRDYIHRENRYRQIGLRLSLERDVP